MREHRELQWLTLAEASRLVRRKKVSPVDLVQACLDQIEAVDRTINCWVTVLPEQALENARKAEAEILAGNYRGPLHGIPFGVKDICATKGIKTTWGSRIGRTNIPDHDATCVAKLREAGAILLGKITTHEFAYGVTSPPSRNPWNPECVTGGSSGGSGGAVAAGEVYLALGTDTGCSVRNPAALCGVSAVRVTQGRVSTFGVAPLAWSIDTVGPLTRTVEDAALALQMLSGFDPLDPGSSTAPVPNFRTDIGKPVTGLRLGVPKTYFFEHLESDLRQLVETAIDELVRLGMERVDIDLPNARYGGGTFMGIIVPESTAYHDQHWMAGKASDLGVDVKAFVSMGQLMLAKDYLKAQQMRTILRRDFEEAFAKVDAIVTPTVAATAARVTGHPIFIDVDYPDGYKEDVFWAYCRFTMPISLAGCPCVIAPCGFAGNGLPTAIQIVTPAFDECTALRIGHAYQQATSFHRNRPPCAIHQR